MNSQSLAGSGARPAFPVPSKDALGPWCPGTLQGPTERPGMQPLQQGLEAAAYSQSPMYQPSVTNPLLLQGLVLHLLLRLDSGTTGSSCGVTPWVACDYPLLKATWRPSMISTISEQHSKDIEERTSLCLVLLPCASC